MPVHDDLGKRMKENYESIPKYRLMRRTPVIIRIDGKAFHTFTRGFKKPFDMVLVRTMQETMKYLCENIQGCVFGYTQSDEISLLLVDYKRFNSSAWFDNEIQKMCSISASLATLSFNINFHNIYSEIDPVIQFYACSNAMDESDKKEIEENWKRVNEFGFNNLEDLEKYCSKYRNKSYISDAGATFDSRVFNIPKEEVTNYFYWRQIDAIRNATEMVGQANFSHKELHKKSCNNIKEMLEEQKNIKMDDFAIDLQRGSCCYKETYTKDDAIRTRWVIDRNIPIFNNEGREYIDKWIEPEQE